MQSRSAQPDLTQLQIIELKSIMAGESAVKKSTVQEKISELIFKNIKQQVDKLDECIRRYNAATTLEEKLQQFILVKIYAERVRDILPGHLATISTDFQNKFLRDFQAALHQQAQLLYPPTAQFGTPSFSHILSAMPYGKLQNFMQLLSAGAACDYKALENLYEETDLSEEAQDYRAFFQNHTITFLGGSNTQNFTLTRRDTNEASVIKIEYRFNIPKAIERKLRAGALNNILLPIHAESAATFMHEKHGKTTCSILETELVPTSDLEIYMKGKTNIEERTSAAVDLYQQMCDIFITLQDNSVAFLDAKNSNWLVNPEGKLQLADTKSFVPVQPNGELDKNKNHLKGYDPIITKVMSPPELQSSSIMNAEAVHCYLLGKNLYQSLTGARIEDLKQISFTHPVFDSEVGKKLKHIIENTTQENDHSARMRLADIKQALQEVQELQYLQDLRELQEFQPPQEEQPSILKKEVEQKLEELTLLKSGSDHQFETMLRSRIVDAKHPTQLQECKNLIEQEITIYQDLAMCRDDIEALEAQKSTDPEIQASIMTLSKTYKSYAGWIVRSPIQSDLSDSPERTFILEQFREFLLIVSAVKVAAQSADPEEMQFAKEALAENIKKSKDSPYFAKYDANQAVAKKTSDYRELMNAGRKKYTTPETPAPLNPKDTDTPSPKR